MIRCVADALLRAGGALVVVVTLADVFLTVLFPASGHGPLRKPLSRSIWWCFRTVGRRLSGQRSRAFLTYCGPVLVVLSIAVWPLLLVVGWAMIYLPTLGTGLVASSGETVRTWVNALYVSGWSLTTLGTGDIVPTSGLYRMLMVVEAATGFSVVTMVVTYFLSVYSAITQRKTFAAALHHRTGRTGDSVRLITGLASQGDVSSVIGELSSTGSELQHMFQTHESYPVLRWFHFRQVRYASPRILLTALDAAALAGSALDVGRGGAGDMPAVVLVDGAARDLLRDLLRDLVPETSGGRSGEPGEDEALRRRFTDAVAAFRGAGLAVREDPQAAEDYLRRRAEWEPSLRALAAAMLYEWDEVRPGPGAVTGSVDSRQ